MLLALAVLSGLLAMHVTAASSGHAGRHHVMSSTTEAATAPTASADCGAAGGSDPTATHRAACDLAAPPVARALAPALWVLLAVAASWGAAVARSRDLRSWLRRRGPPDPQELRLALCVTRV